MMKTLRSNRGSVALMAVGAVSVSVLIVGAASLAALSSSRKSALRTFYKDQPTSVIDAIKARALRELTELMRNPEDGSDFDGTLRAIINPRTGFTPAFNVNSPKIYGKGEFQLKVIGSGIPLLDTMRSSSPTNSTSTDTTLASKTSSQITTAPSTSTSTTASSTPSTTATPAATTSSTALFTAPETDPKVWIESSGSNCNVILHIQTKLCSKILTKRIAFSNGATGLGVNWDPACPADSLQDIDYKTFLNLGSPLFAGSEDNQCTNATANSGNGGDNGLTIEGYWRPVVVHSQQPEIPQCPKGLTQMWQGYSYLGSSLSNGYNSGQDLGKPGSCLERFNNGAAKDNGPLMALECNKDWCWYQSPGDYSTWMVTQGSAGNNWLMDFGKAEKAALAPNLISRCVVCQSTRPVIVKHSYAATIPTCPDGWVSQWTGFSFAGGGIDDRAEYPQELGDTGSCLKLFVPNPITRCTTSQCDRGAVFYSQRHMWLLNLATQADTTNRDIEDHWLENAARISRCNVCMKK